MKTRPYPSHLPLHRNGELAEQIPESPTPWPEVAKKPSDYKRALALECGVLALFIAQGRLTPAKANELLAAVVWATVAGEESGETEAV